jgi:hypothetical protein
LVITRTAKYPENSPRIKNNNNNNNNNKGKVPVLFLTEHYTMKAFWGSGGITPLIL